MNKILMTLLITVSTSCMADISVNWVSTGFVSDSGNGYTTTDRYAQLLWSSTDPSSHQAVWGSAGYLAADEVLLAGFTVDDPNKWGQFLTDLDGAAVYNAAGINNGWLFSRIFESSTVISSTKYYQSIALSPTLKLYDAQTPSTVIDYNSTSGMAVLPSSAMTVVPEPSTVGLLLVGIGLVAARRLRRG